MQYLKDNGDRAAEKWSGTLTARRVNQAPHATECSKYMSLSEGRKGMTAFPLSPKFPTRPSGQGNLPTQWSRRCATGGHDQTGNHVDGHRLLRMIRVPCASDPWLPEGRPWFAAAADIFPKE
jgi:hypothetical protein